MMIIDQSCHMFTSRGINQKLSARSARGIVLYHTQNGYAVRDDRRLVEYE